MRPIAAQFTGRVNIQVDGETGLQNVFLGGEFDCGGEDELRRGFDELDPSKPIHIDLGEVTYMDGGLRNPLFALAKKVREAGGTVRLVKDTMPGSVQRQFELLGMGNIGRVISIC